MLSHDPEGILLGAFQMFPVACEINTPEHRLTVDLVKLHEAHKQKEVLKTMIVCEFSPENLELCLEMSTIYYGLEGFKSALGISIDYREVERNKELLEKYSEDNFLWIITGMTKEKEEDLIKNIPQTIKESSLYLIDSTELTYDPLESFFDPDGLIASVKPNEVTRVSKGYKFIHTQAISKELHKKIPFIDLPHDFTKLVEDSLIIREQLAQAARS